MKIDKLTDAMKEAERFLVKAEVACHSLRTDKFAYMSGTKETGACRRASMDLTRALAELRKP